MRRSAATSSSQGASKNSRLAGAANEQFETLVSSILRDTPLGKPTVLAPKSLRRILQVTEGITANIFHMINSLAADAAQSAREPVTDEVVQNWRPLSDGGADRELPQRRQEAVGRRFAAGCCRTLVIVDRDARRIDCPTRWTELQPRAFVKDEADLAAPEEVFRPHIAAQPARGQNARDASHARPLSYLARASAASALSHLVVRAASAAFRRGAFCSKRSC